MYIQKVELKGYKSIQALSVRLKAGLNIIIGQNGSGKTNFLNFLQTIVERNYWTVPPNFYAHLVFKNDVLTQWKVQSFYKKGEKDNRIEEIYNKSKYKIPYPTNSAHSFQLPEANLLHSIGAFSKITYEIPKQIPFLDFPARLSGDSIIRFPEFSAFALFLEAACQSLISRISTNFLEDPTFEEVGIEPHLSLPNRILTDLQRFTPIQGFRTAKGHSVKQYEFINFDIFSLTFELLVQGKWLRWEQLSDGTKRLFYLIFEISYHEKGVFCVEEPELGIHPDQLYKLMDFLKVQAETKQIIITTHSPEVLNILEKKELDRIIVTRYVPEQGTKMHLLSPQKIKKGQVYMDKVGHLSDFWVHSNLEEYEEN